MSKRANTGKARGRPKGKETDVAVLREDGTFEHKSRRDILEDPRLFQEREGAAETTNGNAVPEDPVRQGGAVENSDQGAGFAAGSEADLEEGLPEVSFCMPEFDRKKGTLNHQAYAMPGLCQIAVLGGGVGIAHWCSCCPEMELQKSIFSGVRHPPLSPQYLCGQADKCIHLEVLIMLAASLRLDAEGLCGLPRVGASGGEDDAEGDGVYLLPFVGEAPKAWVLGTSATECIVVIETKTGGRRCTSCYGKG
ncbi:hypothetical protein KFL_000300170 [Klebsormidium nitens]|uniref:Uncharacterized protein n=1 Tax=Klebsormidium nitens TaxID=105231 RepID=A0A0U9HHZ3_KLENI|nr:hypothetical protein KFL_000300170 [Klebsormidium nitens]|eukprot:GAQ79419.1 hypothetical protein KFL_000300170 [Klebsormidium nitens]